jgi:hypothetical protein
VVCPCNVDCDKTDAPGKCADSPIDPPTKICKEVDPKSFGTCLAIVGYVFDGKGCVVASGCGCGTQCAAVFKTLEECKISCKGNIGGGGSCCKGDKECPKNNTCVSGVCKENKPPYCWNDSQCKVGGKCQFVTVCPCGATCAKPDKPGKCAVITPPPSLCKPVKPDAFGDCPAILGWAWTGLTCKEISGCNCAPACKSFYDTEGDCMKSCSKLQPIP